MDLKGVAVSVWQRGVLMNESRALRLATTRWRLLTMLMNESGGGRKEKVAGLGGREGKNYLLLRTPSTLPLSVALPLRRARIRLERCIFQPSRLRSQKKPCFSLCVDQLLGSNGMHTTRSRRCHLQALQMGAFSQHTWWLLAQ